MIERYETYKIDRRVYFSPPEIEFREEFDSWEDFINSVDNKSWGLYEYVGKEHFLKTVQSLHKEIEITHAKRKVEIKKIIVEIGSYHEDDYNDSISYFASITVEGERLMTQKAAEALEKKEKAAALKKAQDEEKQKKEELKILRALMKKYANELEG